ncbi:hypothetical protein HID58_065275 [Brassica napus]|uniref:Uncharacterized protein n=1 Tax=Brassica napus TaxID=3708 RepID=A0ABQ7ZCU0_BRANA|nr:hypothetical protein HID58_065275 [Brassica napus]
MVSRSKVERLVEIQEGTTTPKKIARPRCGKSCRDTCSNGKQVVQKKK